ncbi:MAG: sugar nucleotide-binding protein [Gammaproteobacteria bacterium]|nr:sugar nucleotide-binding protein [Gammaproteobacteria bacterium]
MKLFIVGGNSPTAKDLIEILRRQRVSFHAPADKYFNSEDGVAIAKMITDYGPTQLINLADFISGNHSSLRRAETTEERCYEINSKLPLALAEITNHLNIPVIHLSNAYVFDGLKRLSYNENDETNPQGIYGLASLQGEQAIRKHPFHVIIRSGWLFGRNKKGLIKSWIRVVKRDNGRVPVSRRRFSPTYTMHLAAAILAISKQIECDANVWGTYHYSSLETKLEYEFVEQVIKYAASHDEKIYQLLNSLSIVERESYSPEVVNSTLSSKKLFDTFGIKQKSWHGDLQKVIELLYDRNPDLHRKKNQKHRAETSLAENIG